MHRTQIYLEEVQAARLDERAAAEGTSRSTVIRRAVDEYLAHADRDAAAWREQWRRAVDRTSGVAPGLADGSEYVEDLRRHDARRLTDLGP